MARVEIITGGRGAKVERGETNNIKNNDFGGLFGE
jgi:hypothetical protein